MKLFDFYKLIEELAPGIMFSVPGGDWINPKPISFHGRPVMSSGLQPRQAPSQRRLVDFCRLLDSFEVGELNEDMVRALGAAAKPLTTPLQLRRGSAGFAAYYRLRDKHRLEDAPRLIGTVTGRMSSFAPNLQNMPRSR